MRIIQKNWYGSYTKSLSGLKEIIIFFESQQFVLKCIQIVQRRKYKVLNQTPIIKKITVISPGETPEMPQKSLQQSQEKSKKQQHTQQKNPQHSTIFSKQQQQQYQQKYKQQQVINEKKINNLKEQWQKQEKQFIEIKLKKQDNSDSEENQEIKDEQQFLTQQQAHEKKILMQKNKIQKEQEIKEIQRKQQAIKQITPQKKVQVNPIKEQQQKIFKILKENQKSRQQSPKPIIQEPTIDEEEIETIEKLEKIVNLSKQKLELESQVKKMQNEINVISKSIQSTQKAKALPKNQVKKMIEISDDKDAQKRARELIKRLKQNRSQFYQSEDNGAFSRKIAKEYENSMRQVVEDEGFLKEEKQKQLLKQSEQKRLKKLMEEEKQREVNEFMRQLKAQQYQGVQKPTTSPQEEMKEQIQLPKIKISKQKFNNEQQNDSIQYRKKRPKSPLIKQIIQEDKKQKEQYLVEKLQKRELYLKKKEYSQQVCQNFLPKSKYEQDYYRNKFAQDLDEEIYKIRSNKRLIQPIEQLRQREEKIQQLLNKDKNYIFLKQREIENYQNLEKLEGKEIHYEGNEELDDYGNQQKEKMSPQKIIEMVYTEKKRNFN